MFKKRILIADDHAIFREGLKQVIGTTADLQVVDEADSGQDALKKVRQADYDLVILDISLPDKNGLHVLADIKRLKPSIPVLILSMYPEEQFGLRALKAGASGYLTKGSSAKDISDALHRIIEGKKYISPSLGQILADGMGTAIGRPLHEALSPREYQITSMIAAGKKPMEIAEELAMSVKTVGTHRARIFKKMNVKSNAELIRYYVEQDLI